MHCFVLTAKGLNLDDVKQELRQGSPKSKYFFQTINMSHRRCFDLVRAFHCVRPLLGTSEKAFYVGTSGFSYAEVFMLKHSNSIQLYVNVSSPLTFLSQQDMAMVYEIEKSMMLNFDREEEGQNAATDLRKALLDSLLNHK